MSRRHERAKLCATPSKRRHASEQDAVDAAVQFEADMLRARLPFRPLYVYPCPCLAWHWTHHAFSRESTPHRKATP